MILLILCASTFGSCYDKLSDENKHLYTVAINSSINLHIDGEAPSRFIVLETDSYGRILFTFPSYYYNLCILQKSDAENVYYYEDICFMEFKERREITDEVKAKIKELNDWDCELTEDKMIKKAIELPKNYHERMHTKTMAIESMFNADSDTSALYYRYITSNEAGLKLYFVRIDENGNTSDSKSTCYFVVLNSDYKLISDDYILEHDAKDINDSESIVKLKQRINWHNE